MSARLGTSFLVWLVVGIALALPAGLWLVQINMQAMTEDWQGRPGLSVYFGQEATTTNIAEAKAVLEDQNTIESVRLITADEALLEFKQLSGLGDALELLEKNPLPASMRAQFAEGVEGGVVDALTGRISVLPGIQEVVVEKTWLERLNDISAVISRLSVVLAVLFGLGAVLVTASSVRLAIESRLEELRVLKLVGATAGQVRRPFLYFGAVYGFGGGVIAAMLIVMTILVIEPPLQSLLGSYEQALELAGLDSRFLVSLLLIGGGLGVMGALLAVHQRRKDLEIF